jgi:hypothetical protein
VFQAGIIDDVSSLLFVICHLSISGNHGKAWSWRVILYQNTGRSSEIGNPVTKKSIWPIIESTVLDKMLVILLIFLFALPFCSVVVPSAKAVRPKSVHKSFLLSIYLLFIS